MTEPNERFVQGDLDAFEDLFREFQGKVFGWILRIVRDADIAEELTIETFWRIYRARARFDPQRPFGAWARRIATNVAIDYWKSERRDERFRAESSAEPVAVATVDTRMRAAMEKAFQQLPVKLRVAAVLAIVEERPYDEISAALGISNAALKSRVFRAIRILRQKLRRAGVAP